MRQPDTWGTGERRPQYWVNLRTREIEEGRLSPAGHRMGPYDTRQEAELAFETAAERIEAWEEDSERWREEWDGEDDDDGAAPMP